MQSRWRSAVLAGAQGLVARCGRDSPSVGRETPPNFCRASAEWIADATRPPVSIGKWTALVARIVVHLRTRFPAPAARKRGRSALPKLMVNLLRAIALLLAMTSVLFGLYRFIFPASGRRKRKLQTGRATHSGEATSLAETASKATVARAYAVDADPDITRITLRSNGVPSTMPDLDEEGDVDVTARASAVPIVYDGAEADEPTRWMPSSW